MDNKPSSTISIDKPINKIHPNGKLQIFAKSCLVVVLYSGLYLGLNPTIFSALTKSFFGKGDAIVYIWLVKNNMVHVLSCPGAGFDISIFFPFGNALAFTDNYLLPSFISLLFYKLTSSEVIAYNLSLLIACVLNGYVTFLLARYLTRDDQASFFAGFAFMGAPWFFSQLNHPQLQFAFVIPVVLLATLSFCEKRTIWSGTCIGLAIVIAQLCSVYYAIFAIFLSSAAFFGYFLLRFRFLRVKDFVMLLLGNIPWIILMYFFIKPYREVRNALAGRQIQDIELPAGIFSFFSAPPSNWLWGEWTHKLSNYETHFFAGITILILFTFGVYKGIRGNESFAKHNEEIFRANQTLRIVKYVFMFALVFWGIVQGLSFFHVFNNNISTAYLPAVSFWILLGVILILLTKYGWIYRNAGTGFLRPEAIILLMLFLLFLFLFASYGRLEESPANDSLPGLFVLLFHYIPGFDALRSAGRFGIVVYLCICLLAGFGFHFLKQSGFCKNLPKRSMWALLGILTALVFAEFKCRDFPLHRPLPSPAGTVYEDLASLPGKEAVIALPFTPFYGNEARFSALQTQYMHLLQATARPMVNGYSGKIPKFHTEIDAFVKNFPDEKSISFLGRLVGLRYVIFNARHAEHFRKKVFERKLSLFSQQLKWIGKDQGGNYLFEFFPVLRVDDLKLFLPPYPSKERHLTFQLRYEQSIPDDSRGRRAAPLRINVAVIHRHSNTEYIAALPDIVLDRTSKWIDVDITLPESIEPVLPYTLKFEIQAHSENHKVLMRDVKIVPVSSPLKRAH